VGRIFRQEKSRRNFERKITILYPYLEVDYRRAESLKPEFDKPQLAFSDCLIVNLQGAVRDLRDELQPYPKVRLQYSDVLAKLDISKIEMINAHDAWHFSPLGHGRVARQLSTRLLQVWISGDWIEDVWLTSLPVSSIRRARLIPRAQVGTHGKSLLLFRAWPRAQGDHYRPSEPRFRQQRTSKIISWRQ